MTAASFWSLLDPAFRIAHEENFISTEVNFFLIFNGFLLGAAFVYMTDLLLPSFESKDVFKLISKKKFDDNEEKVRQEKHKWNRLLLLIIAVTVHNFPEGLAVGVGFGSIPTSNNATSAFNNARNLAVGIGIQNFPEGLAISLPLRSFGVGSFKAFWFGQLSGLVEVFAGLLGVFFVQLSHSVLPFALSFAAGAMLFVVFNEIIPEISPSNRTISSWCVIAGFTIMMMLDVIFG